MRRAVGSLSIREYWLLAEQGADQVAQDHQLKKGERGLDSWQKTAALYWMASSRSRDPAPSGGKAPGGHASS